MKFRFLKEILLVKRSRPLHTTHGTAKKKIVKIIVHIIYNIIYIIKLFKKLLQL